MALQLWPALNIDTIEQDPDLGEMTSGMMIGRGNGRDQFGAGNSGLHANAT
jgi:hypothetical protein